MRELNTKLKYIELLSVAQQRAAQRMCERHLSEVVGHRGWLAVNDDLSRIHFYSNFSKFPVTCFAVSENNTLQFRLQTQQLSQTCMFLFAYLQVKVHNAQ